MNEASFKSHVGESLNVLVVGRCCMSQRKNQGLILDCQEDIDYVKSVSSQYCIMMSSKSLPADTGFQIDVSFEEVLSEDLEKISL